MAFLFTCSKVEERGNVMGQIFRKECEASVIKILYCIIRAIAFT